MDFSPGYFLVDSQPSMVRLLILRSSAASFTVNSLRCCAAVLLCCCAAVLLCCCAAVLLCYFLKFYHTYCRNVKKFLRIGRKICKNFVKIYGLLGLLIFSSKIESLFHRCSYGVIG
jgi:hypothetical protein